MHRMAPPRLSPPGASNQGQVGTPVGTANEKKIIRVPSFAELNHSLRPHDQIL
jgi:hypothetical protein